MDLSPRSPLFSSDAPFDHVFTDQELQDLLGYMERQQSLSVGPAAHAAGAPEQEVDSLPFLQPATATASLSLQFQPHQGPALIPRPQLPTSAAAAAPALVPVTQEGIGSFDLPLSVPVELPAKQQQAAGQRQQQATAQRQGSGEAAEQHLQRQGSWPQQQQQQQQQHEANGSGREKRGQAKSKETKQHVSHSVVEKQRRDRINSLINELRELVPPQHHEGHYEMHEGRRAKHVVLSDAISLIKDLQQKLAIQQQDHGTPAQPPLSAEQLQNHQQYHQHYQQQQQYPPHPSTWGSSLAASGPPSETPSAAPSGVGGGGGSSAPSAAALAQPPSQQQAQAQQQAQQPASSDQQARSSGAASGGGVDPELPHTTAEAEEVPLVRQEVVVEESDGCLFVKVHAHDRHGLLADIVKALKALPLEISSAAVTTTKGRGVYDVFALTREENSSEPAPSTEEIRRAVEEAVFLPADHVGTKRRHE